MLKTIVVDDDAVTRKIVCGYTEKSSELELFKDFDNIESLIDEVDLKQVDLLLLDINLPGMSGIDFIYSLENPPKVIFITSSEEYAVRAFDLNVVDYIVKPLSPSRFNKALDKLKDKEETKEEGLTYEGSIFVKHNSQLVKLDLKSIDYIESMGDYIAIFSQKTRYVVYGTMKDAEKQMPTSDFIRVHRSYIVNVNSIESIEEDLIVIGEKNIPVSRSYKKSLLKKLNVF